MYQQHAVPGGRSTPTNRRSSQFLRDISLEYSFEEMQGATLGWHPTRKLGSGSYGAVYKGELEDGSEVAIKDIDLGPLFAQGQSPEMAGFEDEVQTLSKFRHPHLVTLLGWGKKDHHRYLVYELLAGGDAHARLRKSARQGADHRPFLWHERLSICLDSATGLSHMHNSKPKAFHRDIKSANILLDRHGTAKMADFGLCCTSSGLQGDRSVKVNTISGTPGYACPIYSRTGVVTEGSEMYSFGMVMLEILTGLAPAAPDPHRPGSIVYPVQEHLMPSHSGALERCLRQLDASAGWPPALAREMVLLALRCVERDDDLRRPRFVEVVRKLRSMRECYPASAPCRTLEQHCPAPDRHALDAQQGAGAAADAEETAATGRQQQQQQQQPPRWAGKADSPAAPPPLPPSLFLPHSEAPRPAALPWWEEATPKNALPALAPKAPFGGARGASPARSPSSPLRPRLAWKDAAATPPAPAGLLNVPVAALSRGCSPSRVPGGRARSSSRAPEDGGGGSMGLPAPDGATPRAGASFRAEETCCVPGKVAVPVEVSSDAPHLVGPPSVGALSQSSPSRTRGFSVASSAVDVSAASAVVAARGAPFLLELVFAEGLEVGSVPPELRFLPLVPAAGSPVGTGSEAPRFAPVGRSHHPEVLEAWLPSLELRNCISRTAFEVSWTPGSSDARMLACGTNPLTVDGKIAPRIDAIPLYPNSEIGFPYNAADEQTVFLLVRFVAAGSSTLPARVYSPPRAGTTGAAHMEITPAPPPRPPKTLTPGRPRACGRWRLVCMHAEGLAAQDFAALPEAVREFEVGGAGVVRIGRHHQARAFEALLSGAPMCLSYISRTHLQLEVQGSGLWMTNVSSNQIYVNSEPVAKGESRLVSQDHTVSFARLESSSHVLFLKLQVHAPEGVRDAR